MRIAVIGRGMNAATLAKIQNVANQNIARLSADAAAKLAAAKADPLNADAVRRAVESRADLAGYERAIREIVDGMVALAVDA